MRRNRNSAALWNRIGIVILLLSMMAMPVLGGGSAESATGAQEFDVVRFVEVNWMDIAATTAAASLVLEGLGYETETTIVSVPIAYQALAAGDADLFLGFWTPSMDGIANPYFDNGTVENLGPNLVGAKYTLAVPTYMAEAGLTHFRDIADHVDELNGTIHGIEAGNDGNMLIQAMIDDNAYGLSEFEILESSEAGMLAEVRGRAPEQQWIVFLGWEPHPMNSRIDMTYLEGGEDYFGPDLGAAEVHTNVRSGLVEERPNLGRFLNNLEYTLGMENEIMVMMDDGAEPRDAARRWLQQNPEIIATWVAGVATADGSDPLESVYRYLEIN